MQLLTTVLKYLTILTSRLCLCVLPVWNLVLQGPLDTQPLWTFGTSRYHSMSLDAHLFPRKTDNGSIRKLAVSGRFQIPSSVERVNLFPLMEVSVTAFVILFFLYLGNWMRHWCIPECLRVQHPHDPLLVFSGSYDPHDLFEFITILLTSLPIGKRW